LRPLCGSGASLRRTLGGEGGVLQGAPAERAASASWLGVQILSDPSGRPRLEILDERLKRALAEAGASAAHISITHERACCAAVAVLE